jgi:Na+/melibiose symporter-like transporter
MSTPPDTAGYFGWQQGWRYGLMGLPLAFVALPLYVLLPNHYARSFGMPLALLGALLLGARLFDALIDPVLGRWSDGLYARSSRRVLRMALLAVAALALGFVLLFFPPVAVREHLAAWALACLVLTYAAYSLLSILHQSWGAMLGGDESQRSRIVAWREGLGLSGVLLASIIPATLGLTALSATFIVALGLGWLAWRQARAPLVCTQEAATVEASLWLPLRRPAFRALISVFLVNGIASAIPATLLLFFVQDRLQASPSHEPLFLGSYFACAALSIPLWLRLVRRLGLARAWGLGMLLSVAVFVFAFGLGAGDSAAFVLVCALSGVGLGADLSLPGALLAGCIADNHDRGRGEGRYVGWWNFVTKLNLALAAGLALPALGALGYVPGSREPDALHTLAIAYCLLPCALKLLAAGLLYTLIIRRTP